MTATKTYECPGRVGALVVTSEWVTAGLPVKVVAAEAESREAS